MSKTVPVVVSRREAARSSFCLLLRSLTVSPTSFRTPLGVRNLDFEISHYVRNDVQGNRRGPSRATPPPLEGGRGVGRRRRGLSVRHSPFSILHSQFSIFHFSFSILHSSFPIPHSPFPIPHSPSPSHSGKSVRGVVGIVKKVKPIVLSASTAFMRPWQRREGPCASEP